MLDYLIANFFSNIEAAHKHDNQKYESMYDEVVRRTAKLVAKW